MELFIAIVLILFARVGFAQTIEVLNAQNQKVDSFTIGDRVYIKSINNKCFRRGRISAIKLDSIFIQKQGYSMKELSHIGLVNTALDFKYGYFMAIKLAGGLFQVGIPIFSMFLDMEFYVQNGGWDYVFIKCSQVLQLKR